MGKNNLNWDQEIFDAEGRPKQLTPEAWFAYAVQKAGGTRPLAKTMGVSRQTIYASWRGRFPDKYVVAAEKAFGIPRKVLAPHLFE